MGSTLIFLALSSNVAAGGAVRHGAFRSAGLSWASSEEVIAKFGLQFISSVLRFGCDTKTYTLNIGSAP